MHQKRAQVGKGEKNKTKVIARAESQNTLKEEKSFGRVRGVLDEQDH